MTEKKTLTMEEMVTERRMSRRDTLSSVGLGVAGAALATVGFASSGSAQEAVPQCSDSDPYDPGGRGRHCGGGYSGCSDSDPYDPGGNGRHCGRTCSDSDPYDPGGHGRHC